jgi:hypothetical protein
MKEFLTSGQVGNIELEQQRKLRQTIEERWDKLGFCEGLKGHIKENIATLYENQAKSLINESTSSESSGSFETVVFPLIRRIFSKLLANDIVSVQAMNLPVGKLFFILPVTSKREYSGSYDDLLTAGNKITGEHNGLMGYDRVNRNDSGNTEARYYLPDSVVASGTSTVKFFEKTLYDLFYDDFLFDQSKGKVTLSSHAGEVVVLQPNGEFVSGTTPMSFDGTYRNAMFKVKGFNEFNAGRLIGPDGNEMDTEAFLASMKVLCVNAISGDSGHSSFARGESVPFRVVTQKYGQGIVNYNSVCDAKGEMFIELDLAKPAKGTEDGYAGLSAAPTSAQFVIAWASYDSLELETEMGEVSFKLDSVTVSVEERKLRATWSPELSQDVSAFHNIDAEAELTALLSEQISGEIDREILRDLRKLAPWTSRFDYSGWRKMNVVSTNYTQKDWNQMLITKINQVSAQIHKATLRGGANFIVVSTEVSAVFNDLEYFHVSDASSEQNQYNMGIEKIGSLQGRYQVYVDPYAPAYSVIIGHKGKSLLDTGYIYAPYVPMSLTPTMYNPENFAPVKGIMTRYAKKCVNNRYYGHVRVDGLTTWNTMELR